MEGTYSANTYPFLERSPINLLDPSRNWGLGYFGCTTAEDATLAGGLFHAGTDPSDFQNGPGANTAITARGTRLPLRDESRLVDVGLAMSSRVPDDDVFVIVQRPEAGDVLVTTPVVRVGIDARSGEYCGNGRECQRPRH